MNGRSYIIQSVLILAAYAVLAAIVTVRVFSATPLSSLTQFSVCGFLWGAIVWFVIILRRYYHRLPNE